MTVRTTCACLTVVSDGCCGDADPFYIRAVLVPTTPGEPVKTPTGDLMVLSGRARIGVGCCGDDGQVCVERLEATTGTDPATHLAGAVWEISVHRVDGGAPIVPSTRVNIDADAITPTGGCLDLSSVLAC